LGGFLKHAGTRRKHAETAMEGGIAGIAGSKVTNKWGLKASSPLLREFGT
jgi:hypothetical protein